MGRGESESVMMKGMILDREVRIGGEKSRVGGGRALVYSLPCQYQHVSLESA